MNYEEYFLELITEYLASTYDRECVASKIATDIGIDEIEADATSLITNCEWALRHINDDNHYTTDDELKYYRSCLKKEKIFSQKARDTAIDK